MRNGLVAGLALVAAVGAVGCGHGQSLERAGHRIQMSVAGGALNEVYEVRTAAGWREVLRYEGPQLRLHKRPEGQVLFDFEEAEQWRSLLQGLPPQVVTQSTRCPFGVHGETFVGTCEDGSGGYNDDYVGQLELGPVTLPHRYVSLLVGGGRRPDDAYVAVFDAESGDELERATGLNNERLRQVEWDLGAHVGRQIMFRVVDQAKGGWGHINVDCVVSHPGSALVESESVIWTGVEREGDTLVARGRAQWINMTRRIALTDDGAIVSHRVVTSAECELEHYEDRYRFAAGEPDFVWSQSIKGGATDLVPHWQYKSPAVILQAGAVLASIVADLDVLDAATLRRQPTALDLGNRRGQTAWLSYGVVPSRRSSHSVYSRDEDAPLPWNREALTLDHELILSGIEESRAGYRRVVRHLWDRFGRRGFLSTPDLQTNYQHKEQGLFDAWRQEAWHRYAQEVYREFDYDGERCSMLVSRRNKWSNKLGTDEDCWFNSWFQTLRTAYGMYVYGRRAGDERIMEQARGVLNLALHAPQTKGVFPTIYWRDEDGSHHWVRDNGWAGFRDCYHVFDMAWTAYWMLRWRSDLVDDERVVPFCRRFGDFLLGRLNNCGAIPAWFDEELMPRSEMAVFNAETAGAALFLAELSAATGDAKYLAAAEKAMGFVERVMMPKHRWFDYETFLSCSRKPFDFYDEHTQQWPQNNLSTFQAAQACLRLHELTSESHYLELGEQICDYALLTQQVWNHPLLTPKLVGGFTTQNTDAEWSDARQCYAAVILLDYYEATGRLEYLERGVAALRSTFAVAPYENWAHGGSEDRPGAMTGLHWGTGSAMASVEMKHERYRDAYVHVQRQHGVGVNGCNILDVSAVPGGVSFRFETPYEWQRSPVVVIDAADGDTEVIVNGESLGRFPAERLKEGLSLSRNRQ